MVGGCGSCSCCCCCGGGGDGDGAAGGAGGAGGPGVVLLERLAEPAEHNKLPERLSRKRKWSSVSGCPLSRQT